MAKNETRAGNTIRLKPSPLVELVAELLTRYPNADSDLVDSAVVGSKCDPEIADKLLNEPLPASDPSGRHVRSNSFSEWIRRYTICYSQPEAKIRVYRLDGEASSGN